MFFEGGVAFAADEFGDAAAEFFFIEAFELVAVFQGEFDGVVAAAFGNGEDELQEIFLERRRNARHHAEVKDGEPLILGQEDVAGVWISVEKTVHENLLEIGFEKFVGEGFAIDFDAHDGGERGDFLAGDVIHREDFGGGVAFDRFGNNEFFEGGEVGAQGREMLGLLAVVELAQEHGAEFCEGVGEVGAAAGGGVVVEEFRDVAEHVEVVNHAFADAGALNFDRDMATIAQDGFVDLSDGGGGEGLGVNFLKGSGDADAEFLGDDSFDILEWERLDFILEACEGLDVGGGDELGARGEELAELDVGGSEFFEVVGKLIGVGFFLGGGLGVFVGEGFIQPGVFHQVRTAIFPQKEADVFIVLKMLGAQR